jgi:transposase
VAEHFPQAERVVDFFYVVRWIGEAFDCVRKREHRQNRRKSGYGPPQISQPTMPNAFEQPTGKTAYLLRRTMSADHRRGYELLRAIQKRPAFKINGLRFECGVCRVRGLSTAGWLPGMVSKR